MKNDLDKAFSIDEGKYHEFFRDMEERYLPNPYHNATHAADVLNSILYLINQTPLSTKITELELLGVIIASLGHDVAHPALNNRFLVNNAHEIAVKYNDVSVLENMHSAIVFKLLMSEDKNILENLDSADWFYIRRVIVEMILITDMAKHFELLGLFRVKL